MERTFETAFRGISRQKRKSWQRRLESADFVRDAHVDMAADDDVKSRGEQ